MHSESFAAKAIISILLLAISVGSARADVKARKPSILVTGFAQNAMNFLIDPVLEGKLRAEGYRIASMDAGDLTPEKLRLFDEVIFLQEYVTGDWANGRSLDSVAALEAKLAGIQKMLSDYAASGGGLMLFFDEMHYEGSWKYALNSLLSGMDASVTREKFGDTNSANVHVFSLLEGGLSAIKTTDIAKHPVTAGVKEFWYPGQGFSYHGDTMSVGSEWQVVVRGSETSYSDPTYKSHIPVLAVREFGKGNVALFSGLSSYYVNNGYHRAYDSGWMFDKGDGMRLFHNLLDWLGTHPAGVKLGGYKDGTFPPVKPLAWKIQKNPDVKMTAYPGLIGVYTTHSGGECTVAQYAQEAKALGLKFIAFTDKIKTKAEWEALKAECVACTDKDFIAIPRRGLA